jgi:hypothetical protein
MGQDELLLEEQIKKKKRMVLLMLFSLLLVAIGAAALFEPALSPSPMLAEVESSPSHSDQPATPLADTLTNTPTPLQVQGDEWEQPTLSSSSDSDRATPQPTPPTTIPVENKNNSKTSEATRGVSTVIVTSIPATSVEIEKEGSSSETSLPEATFEAVTPQTTANEEGVEASTAVTPNQTSETESNTMATNAPSKSTAVAGVSPGANSDESNESLATVSPEPNNEVGLEESNIPANTSEATPVSTEISKRIHESWDVLDGYDPGSSSEVSTAESITSTTALTGTSGLSESMAILPPNGLPVTGMITRRGMNWAAMALTVVLLGAGAVALLDPEWGRR